MQEIQEKNVNNLINRILTERSADFTWACFSPEQDFYEDYFDTQQDYQEQQIIQPNPTLEILTKIRNLCDTIQTNVVNSGTIDDSFLTMSLLDIQNKLKQTNDTLNSLQNFNNNQQLLTGDIILA